MERVRELGLDELIAERRDAGVPILGICLGLQLLFDSTTELRRRRRTRPAPRRGRRARGARAEDPAHRLVAGALGEGLAPHRGDRERDALLLRPLLRAASRGAGDLLGSAAYGARFACAVERDNVFGVQFHPEKSSAAGLRLLSNFAGICAATPCRRDPLPGDRHPRRPGRAAAAGRLRARDDLRRRSGRRGEALGGRRSRVPARRRPRRREGRASRRTWRRCGGSRRRSSARSRSAAVCATPIRSRRCSTPGPSGS